MWACICGWVAVGEEGDGGGGGGYLHSVCMPRHICEWVFLLF